MKIHGRVLVWDRSQRRTLEVDLVSCPHCEAAIELYPAGPRAVSKAPRGKSAWCDQCHGWVCPTNACATACLPFLRKIDEQVAREQRHMALVGRGR